MEIKNIDKLWILEVARAVMTNDVSKIEKMYKEVHNDILEETRDFYKSQGLESNT